MGSVFWLFVFVGFLVGEGITIGLTCIWFAVGALGAVFAAHFGFPPVSQWIIFLILSGATLLLVRPAAKRLLRPKPSATNADRVLGQTAFVKEEIDNRRPSGQVSILGQIWTARSQDDVVIPAGEQVRVLRIEGVKVFVERIV